jgi:hypothetical protein
MKYSYSLEEREKDVLVELLLLLPRVCSHYIISHVMEDKSKDNKSLFVCVSLTLPLLSSLSTPFTS